MNTEQTTTIFITGVSSGFGRALAEQALKAHYRVVGTVRQHDQLEQFEATAPGHAIGRLLDVTDDEAVTRVIEDIESTVGPIDVLISNAGYGLEGLAILLLSSWLYFS